MPADHGSTKAFLKTLKKFATPTVCIGCAKWGRKDWVGKLYLPKTKEADFLKHYVQHFDCIELNALFYRLFPKSTVQKWVDTADDDSKFCPKFTNIITHIKRLQYCKKETDALLDIYSVFGKKLGTSFIQLDDRFSPKFAERIQLYLKSLPSDFDVVIEFRLPDFSIDSTEVNKTYAAMRELGVSSVITDTAGRRDVMHMKLTTPKVFVRFVGNSLHKTDYQRIDDWINRIDNWLNSGVQTIYFFIHQHDELYSPELSVYMIEKLNKKCGLNVKLSKLMNGDSLFAEK